VAGRVWTVFGMAVFPLGFALAVVEMQQPALARVVPIAVGVVVLIAGALQFSAWKGWAGLMAILLVVGVMDLGAMAVVTAAITVERVSLAGERVARAVGAVVVGAGLFLIARAAGLG